MKTGRKTIILLENELESVLSSYDEENFNNVFGFVDFQNASNYLAFFKYSVILLQHIVLFTAPFLKPLQSD